MVSDGTQATVSMLVSLGAWLLEADVTTDKEKSVNSKEITGGGSPASLCRRSR
jgi:hypothetical protein